MDQICHICKKTKVTPTQAYNKDGQPIRSFKISCAYCGNYEITPEVVDFKILEKHSDEIYRLSAAIFKKTALGETTVLTTVSVPEIIKATIRKPPLEIIDDILEYISQKADSIKDRIEISETDIPRFVLKNYDELIEYIIQIKNLNIWEADRKHENDKKGHITKDYFVVKLTLKGWEKIDDIRKTKIDSKQAFVAMWFKDSMDQYYKNGIKPALLKTGFDPIINMKDFPHNDKIDDLIIAHIRKSGLVIADFTGNRGAVYFEAGFAKGLNIPVIWLCKESNKKKLCFDTRQYNHILWKDADDLKEQLINKIEATIPGHLAK